MMTLVIVCINTVSPTNKDQVRSHRFLLEVRLPTVAQNFRQTIYGERDPTQQKIWITELLNSVSFGFVLGYDGTVTNLWWWQSESEKSRTKTDQNTFWGERTV